MSSARIAAASPDAILKLLDRIAELEAKLAALESQKPVAWNDPDDLLADTAFRWCRIDAFVRPVYLAAGAKPAAHESIVYVMHHDDQKLKLLPDGSHVILRRNIVPYSDQKPEIEGHPV